MAERRDQWIPASAAYLYARCPSCWFVSVRTSQIGVPCERCGMAGVHETFPGGSAHVLHDMVKRFHEEGAVRENRALEALARELAALLAREVTKDTARSVYRTTDQLQPDGAQAAALQARLNRLLGPVSEGQSITIWAKARAATRPTPDEHKVAVILACTLQDSLFAHLLADCLEARGEDSDEARRKVSAMRSLDPRVREFAVATGVPLAKAMDRSQIKAYASRWSQLRRARTGSSMSRHTPLGRAM